MSITINKKTLDIQLTRGDSCSFLLRDGETKEAKVFEVGDIVKLTIKNQVGGDAIISKTISPDASGHIVITLEPSDTSALNYGQYLYDIEWETNSG